MPDNEKKRLDAAISAGESTAKTVRTFQDGAYGAIIEWLSSNIDLDEEKRIRFTTKNIGGVRGFYRLMADLQKKYQKTLLGGILDWAGNLLGINEQYFSEFTETKSIEETALDAVLKRLGYINGVAVPGGYLDAVFDISGIGKQVGGLIQRSIAAKMTFEDFRRLFKPIFVGKAGGGMLERHFNTFAFDLFQRVDRSIQFEYAEKLGLKYAVYSGTIVERSRPFCIERVNKAFTKPQIESWKDLSFQGKPQFGYDPVIDCGGYNCRHHLSWVSDQLGEFLIKKQE